MCGILSHYLPVLEKYKIYPEKIAEIILRLVLDVIKLSVSPKNKYMCLLNTMTIKCESFLKVQMEKLIDKKD